MNWSFNKLLFMGIDRNTVVEIYNRYVTNENRIYAVKHKRYEDYLDGCENQNLVDYWKTWPSVGYLQRNKIAPDMVDKIMGAKDTWKLAVEDAWYFGLFYKATPNNMRELILELYS